MRNMTTQRMSKRLKKRLRSKDDKNARVREESVSRSFNIH
jgi:hypothetical protein